jgi:hypothetical protein
MTHHNPNYKGTYQPRSRRIENRLSCSSNFLSQAGRLELVNSIFSSLPTFFMCTLKIPVTICRADFLVIEEFALFGGKVY